MTANHSVPNGGAIAVLEVIDTLMHTLLHRNIFLCSVSKMLALMYVCIDAVIGEEGEGHPEDR